MSERRQEQKTFIILIPASNTRGLSIKLTIRTIFWTFKLQKILNQSPWTFQRIFSLVLVHLKIAKKLELNNRGGFISLQGVPERSIRSQQLLFSTIEGALRSKSHWRKSSLMICLQKGYISFWITLTILGRHWLSTPQLKTPFPHPFYDLEVFII